MLTILSITKSLSKGQQNIPVRYILQGLDSYYDKVKTKIEISYCKQDKEGTFVFTKIPSESLPIKYDVVIWYKDLKKSELNTELMIYSNSPHFGYTFCYVFNKEGSLLFPEHYPSDFLNVPPRMRNPFESSGFDKHVYCALKRTYKMDLAAVAKTFENEKIPSVRTFSQMQEYSKSMDRQQKQKL